MKKRTNKILWNQLIGLLLLLSLFFWTPKSHASCPTLSYAVGFAKTPITGPILPIGMMGYADISQKIMGIHMPLMSRAMVIESQCDQKPVIAMVVAEIGMVFHSIKRLTLQKLASKAPGVFDESNVMVSATHTHSGIGGYADKILYNITIGGYFSAIEQGIADALADSIWHAYRSKQIATLEINTLKTKKTIQFNRSISAYENNPNWEKAMYQSSIDPEMVALTAKDSFGRTLGSFNWFGVHPVSLSMENRLMSGDNKGLAAYLLEKHMNYDQPQQKSGHNPPFVAGFVQSKAGDVSPYPVEWGPLPEDKGWTRNREHGQDQFELAMQAIKETGEPVKGPVIGESQYVHLSGSSFINRSTGSEEKFSLCGGVLGVSFAAGTENGKPVPIFKEGTIYGTNWPTITLMPQEQQCQGNKVMLLPTGFLGPKSWTANGAPFQIMRIGQLLIAGVPFEVTTMAGRRLERRLQGDLEKFGIKKVVLTSLANEYLHYVTTREEYETQQYEGGSNLFGERSLDAYEDIYHGLARKMAFGDHPKFFDSMFSDSTPSGHFFSPKTPAIDFIPLRVRPDKTLDNYSFGDVVKQPESQIELGQWQMVEWVGAKWEHQDGKNIEKFGTVERLEGDKWILYLGTESPDTTLSLSTIRSEISMMKMSWYPKEPGEYRMCYQGRALLKRNIYKDFYSCSNRFKVINNI